MLEKQQTRESEAIKFYKKYCTNHKIELEVKSIINSKNIESDKNPKNSDSIRSTEKIIESEENSLDGIISLPDLELDMSKKNEKEITNLRKLKENFIEDNIWLTKNEANIINYKKKSNSFTLLKNQNFINEFSIEKKYPINNSKNLFPYHNLNSISVDFGSQNNRQKNNLIFQNILNSAHKDYEISSKCKRKIFRNLIVRDRSTNDYDCQICYGYKENPILVPCCHQEFCFECVKYYVSCQLNEYQFKISHINAKELVIKCPNKNCIHTLKKDFLFLGQDNPENDIEINNDNKFCLLDEESLRKYLKAQEIIRIKNIRGYVFCPFPDCDSFSIKLDNNSKNKKLICEKNNHEFCSVCLKPFHHNKCKLEEIISTQEAKQFKIKKCPKCKFLIQKLDGCNHMTCKNIGCNYQFCWLCLGEYKENHYNNPFSVCYRRSNDTQELSNLNKNRCFVIFKFICLLIMFFILFVCSLIFSAWIIIMIIGVKVRKEKPTDIYFTMKKSSKLNKLNNFIRFWFLVLFAVGYTSLGLLLSSIFIITSPMWLSVIGCLHLAKYARLNRRHI